MRGEALGDALGDAWETFGNNFHHFATTGTLAINFQSFKPTGPFRDKDFRTLNLLQQEPQQVGQWDSGPCKEQTC